MSSLPKDPESLAQRIETIADVFPAPPALEEVTIVDMARFGRAFERLVAATTPWAMLFEEIARLGATDE